MCIFIFLFLGFFIVKDNFLGFWVVDSWNDLLKDKIIDVMVVVDNRLYILLYWFGY